MSDEELVLPLVAFDREKRYAEIRAARQELSRQGERFEKMRPEFEQKYKGMYVACVEERLLVAKTRQEILLKMGDLRGYFGKV